MEQSFPPVKCGYADVRIFEVVKCGCWCRKDPHFTDAHAVCCIRTFACNYQSPISDQVIL